MTRPAVALAAVVVAAFAVYAVAGATVDAPRAFSDELLYMEAGASLADGERPMVRGEPYSYGPLYPLAVAAAVRVTSDLAAAWSVAKLLNALFFALAAVPLFLLARRLLAPWPSVAVGALAVAIPSSMYVSVVMTESLAYLAFAWALYALARVFEKPSWRWQVGALAAIGAAAGVRTQLGALLLAYALGLVLVALVVPGARARPATLGRTYLPTLVAFAAGAAVLLAAPLARGDDPPFLGGYVSLWRSYAPLEVLRWLVYHLANLELYLAVVPLAVAPIVLAGLWRRSRAGDRRHAAFLTLFVVVNATLLLLVAAFNTTIWAGDRLHDRPLFYVVPLWIVVLFLWLRDGLPRPRAAAATGAAFALLLPLTLPLPAYVNEEFGLNHNAAVSSLWSEVGQALGAVNLSVLAAFVVVSVAGVLLVLLLPARLGFALPLVVLAGFVLAASVAWTRAEGTAAGWAAALSEGDRTWVDEAPGGETVTLVTAIGRCSEEEATRAPYLTEFFNRRLGAVVHLGESPDFLPARTARVASDGALAVDGVPLRASAVVAPETLGVAGLRLAKASSLPLVLTRVDGPVRLEGDGWRRDLERSCRR